MNLQSLFPVTLSNSWRNAQTYALPENLRDWLLDPNSLTARLKSHCQHFRVELLGQRVEPCHESEAVALIPTGTQVLIRDVLLYCNEQPHVFARSLLPLSSLTGAEQELATLGTQSLGQVLFNNPSLKRQTIEVAEFDVNSSVAELVDRLNLIKGSVTQKSELWGRRSIFILENKPLMVAEVFLPGAFAYQHSVDSECLNAK
jgi:chorismate--pyruvate lyase